MSRLAFIVCVLYFITVRSQTPQSGYYAARNIDTIGALSKTDNLYNLPLYSDSLASSFCIIIKKEVKAHLHQHHSEHIVVSEGEGVMKMADKTFPVKKGDVVFVPKNTIHSVKTTGKTPLKVISIQAPLFDGKDRIFTEEK